MYSPDRRRGRILEPAGTPPRAKRFLRANNRLTSYSGFAIIRAHAKHDARKACGISVRRNQDAPVRDVRPTGRRQRAPAAAGGGFAVSSAFASDAVNRQEMPRTAVADATQAVTWRIVYRIDADAILVAAVFAKKTEQTPKREIDNCKARLAKYDADTRGL